MKITVIDITMHVPNLEKTMLWYADVLGWKNGCDVANEAGECLYGDVYYSHDPLVGFNLSKTDTLLDPSSFHPLIKIPDADTFYAETKNKDIDITQEPQNQGWGKTMKIRDINGFILEFWNGVEESVT